MTDPAIAELAPRIGVRDAGNAVGASQAGYYRRHRQSPPPTRPAPIPHRGRTQPRALSGAERKAILEQLHSDRFVDLSPTEVWQRCSTKAATSARSPRSTGCCAAPAKCVSAALRPPTRRR